MVVKFILILAWASNGVGFTMQEFDSKNACNAALEWAKIVSEKRGPLLGGRCMDKFTGREQ